MKKTKLLILGGVLVSLTLGTSLLAAGKNSIGIGGRYQVDHSAFEELPFDDGDISYGVNYEYQEDAAFWQLGVLYTPEVGGTNSADYVVTPQINLMLKDDIWRGGIGALMSYIKDDNGEDDWTDLYWQLHLGVAIPIGPLSLTALAHYVFEDYGEIKDFDFDDLEYGAWLSYQF
jgi:hypothetical protein